MVRNIVQQPHLGYFGLVCRSGILLKDIETFGNDLIHSELQHALKHLQVDLSTDLQVLLKEEQRHNMPLTKDDAKDHDGGGKLQMHHGKNIFYVFADPVVVLPVGHLVLVKVLFIRENLSILTDLCLSSLSKATILIFLNSLVASVMSMTVLQ